MSNIFFYYTEKYYINCLKKYLSTYEVDDSYYTNLRKFITELEPSTLSFLAPKEDNPIQEEDKVITNDNNGITIFNAVAIPLDIAITAALFFLVNPATSLIALSIGTVLIGGIDAWYFLLRPNPNINDKLITNVHAVGDNAEYDTIDIDTLLHNIKPSFFKRLTKLFHQEDDIEVIFEPSKYTYDYTYDNPLILSESYNTSSYKSNYVYVDNRLLEDTKSNKSYLYDGKYSVSEVISKDNTLSLRYDIYGNILTPLSQEDKTFSYNTLEYTPQNNLYYVRARYYDPSLSSFISKDTYLGNIYKPTTTNRYAYCSGDPVNNMDLDGHKITNNKEAKAAGYNNYKDYLDAQKYYNKQSNGGKKTSNNVTPSGAYTSDGFDGGSSYHYVPPPPDPRQYYRSLVIGPYVYNTNSHDYISNQLNKKQSIKELVTSNSGGYGAGNYSMLYASTAINLSKAQTELVSNNVNTDSLHQIAGVASMIKPVLRGALVLSSVFPPVEPFIAGLNVFADTLIITAGLDNIQKAVADDNHTAYERVEKVAIGIGEVFYGINDLADIITFVEDYYYYADGTPIYPPNDGFDGKPEKMSLEPGTLIDRYGSESGKYASPYGTPFEERSLPLGADAKSYNVYEVIEPVDVLGGKTSPWFYQPGGGIQYKFNMSIEELIQQGKILPK